MPPLRLCKTIWISTGSMVFTEMVCVEREEDKDLIPHLLFAYFTPCQLGANKISKKNCNFKVIAIE